MYICGSPESNIAMDYIIFSTKVIKDHLGTLNTLSEVHFDLGLADIPIEGKFSTRSRQRCRGGGSGGAGSTSTTRWRLSRCGTPYIHSRQRLDHWLPGNGLLAHVKPNGTMHALGHARLSRDGSTHTSSLWCKVLLTGTDNIRNIARNVTTFGGNCRRVVGRIFTFYGSNETLKQ